MIMNQCRRLASKIVGKDRTYKPTNTKQDTKLRREAKRRSKKLDQAIRADWKDENSRIKLLLLGKYFDNLTHHHTTVGSGMFSG